MAHSCTLDSFVDVNPKPAMNLQPIRRFNTIALESSLSVSFSQPLLDFKETELKKLGIHNSKDRAMMLRSLANYRVVQEDDRPGEMPRPLMLCGLVYSFGLASF